MLCDDVVSNLPRELAQRFPAFVPTERLALTESERTANIIEVENAVNCPCLKSTKEGSCGDLFIKSMRCMLLSADPAECAPLFDDMNACMEAHPEEYASQLSRLRSVDVEEEAASGVQVESPVGPTATLSE
eukprot:Rmarinus@m.8002